MLQGGDVSGIGRATCLARTVQATKPAYFRPCRAVIPWFGVNVDTASCRLAGVWLPLQTGSSPEVLDLVAIGTVGVPVTPDGPGVIVEAPPMQEAVWRPAGRSIRWSQAAWCGRLIAGKR